MKIAVVHSFYSSRQPSGENVVVAAQADALADAGHKVLLHGVRTDDLSKAHRSYPLKAAWSVATGMGIDPRAALADFSPDVVHLHNTFPNLATRWLRDSVWPIVATVHNFRPMCAAGTLFRAGAECLECPSLGSHRAVVHGCYRDSRLASVPLAIRNRDGAAADPVIANATRLIFLSKRARETYAGSLEPSQMSRSAVIPNFAPESADTQEQGDQPERRGWIYVGRLAQEKGILELLRNWPNGEPLTVVGDGPLAGKVASECARLGATVTGSRPHDQVMRMIARARGLVFPSLWPEGLPTVYLEALELGTPVMAWPGNSVADDVLEAGSGVVVQRGHTADGLRELSSDWTRFSQAARRRRDSVFSKQSWTQSIESIYAEAMSRS